MNQLELFSYNCRFQLIHNCVLYFEGIFKYSQVFPGQNGKKPEREMKRKSAILRKDLKNSVKVRVVEQYALKLPGKSSHKYHATEGEVSGLLGENVTNLPPSPDILPLSLIPT